MSNPGQIYVARECSWCHLIIPEPTSSRQMYHIGKCQVQAKRACEARRRKLGTDPRRKRKPYDYSKQDAMRHMGKLLLLALDTGRFPISTSRELWGLDREWKLKLTRLAGQLIG